MHASPLMRFAILSFLLLTWLPRASAQSEHRFLREGNARFHKQDYTAAEETYRKTLEQTPDSYKATYNLANTLYAQKRYEEAAKFYENTLPKLQNDDLRANTYYNLANAHLAQNHLEAGIAAYKEALRLRPSYHDAQYNLSLALKKQRQQQQTAAANRKSSNPNPNPPPPPKAGATPSAASAATAAAASNASQKSAQGGKGSGASGEKNANNPSTTDPEAQALLRIIDDEERKVRAHLRRANTTPPANGKGW